MANLLLRLLPSLMIGLPGVFSSVAFHRAQYDLPERLVPSFLAKKTCGCFTRATPCPQRPAHELIKREPDRTYLAQCYFGITGPDSDSNVPRIRLFDCDQTDKRLEKSFTDCKTTVEIEVNPNAEEWSMISCSNRGPLSPGYVVTQKDDHPPLYDVARFGPSVYKDERMFTTVISSSILDGKETKGVPIKFMMETYGEVLLQIGNQRNTFRSRDLIFEPRKADRDGTTLAFIYPNGEIAFSPSFLEGSGSELKSKPHFAMFFSKNDEMDRYVIEGRNYQYKPRYQSTDFTLNEGLVSILKDCVRNRCVVGQCVNSSSSSSSEENDEQQKSSRKRSSRGSRRSSNVGGCEKRGKIRYLF